LISVALAQADPANNSEKPPVPQDFRDQQHAAGNQDGGDSNHRSRWAVKPLVITDLPMIIL
jgi:hypothetical protein